MEQVGLVLLEFFLAVLQLPMRLIGLQLLLLAFVHGGRQLDLHLQHLISGFELGLLGLQSLHLRLLLGLEIVQLIKLLRHLMLILFDTSFKFLQLCGDLVIQRIDFLQLPTALVQLRLKSAGGGLRGLQLVALELQFILHVTYPVGRREMILTSNIFGNTLQHAHDAFLLLRNFFLLFLLLLGKLLNESSHLLVLSLKQLVFLLIRPFSCLPLNILLHRCELPLVPGNLLLDFLGLALQVDNVLVVLLDLVPQSLLLLRNRQLGLLRLFLQNG
mmetsp:Transcript_28935/g.63717  ORF Transcript_28935/g.63717 Transcript_28935/m.63717 type:complete len:273 (-) Transcript_28935:918-1736(-)